MHDLIGRKITADEWLDTFLLEARDNGLKQAIYFYFWHVSGGSSDVILGHHVYTSDKTVFHKLVVKPLHRVFSTISHWKREFRYRCIKEHRYNVVYTDLKPGYYDIDHIMLYANFKLLERYVVDEMGGVEEIEKYNSYCKDEGNSEHVVTANEEAVSLYNWWKVELPSDKKERDRNLMIAYSQPMQFKDADTPGFKEVVFPKMSEEEAEAQKKFRHYEKKILADEDNNLVRLMKIRRALWT